MARLGRGIDFAPVPLGRLGTTQEIGQAAVYLASNETGGYVSGHTLVVDGAAWLFSVPFIPREVLLDERKKQAKL